MGVVPAAPIVNLRKYILGIIIAAFGFSIALSSTILILIWFDYLVSITRFPYNDIGAIYFVSFWIGLMVIYPIGLMVMEDAKEGFNSSPKPNTTMAGGE